MAEKEDARARRIEREFLEAYEENADALLRHALLRVRDREAAKDVVQEAFARTWLHLSKGRQVEHPRAFLYRVANNVIIDRSRRKKAESLDALMEEQGFEPRDEHAADPADSRAARDAARLVEGLGEIYRIVVVMRYVEDMSPKEIAGALGLSENVVSVRLHRALARLRKSAARGGPAEEEEEERRRGEAEDQMLP